MGIGLQIASIYLFYTISSRSREQRLKRTESGEFDDLLALIPPSARINGRSRRVSIDDQVDSKNFLHAWSKPVVIGIYTALYSLQISRT